MEFYIIGRIFWNLFVRKGKHLLFGFEKGSCSSIEGFWSKNRSIESNKLWNLFGNIFNEGKLTEADPKGFWLIQTEKQQANFILTYHCQSQSLSQKKRTLNPSDLCCTVPSLHKQILNSPQRMGVLVLPVKKDRDLREENGLQQNQWNILFRSLILFHDDYPVVFLECSDRVSFWAWLEVNFSNDKT